MTIEVLDTGVLTPQQVLSKCLEDEIETIRAVIVIRVTVEGDYLISHSDCLASERAMASVLLGASVVEDAHA